MTTADAVKNSNATFIDIREAYELEIDGKIEGAINIPLTQIPDRVDEIKQMSKPIVVFCRGGNRATSAFSFLIEKGVEELYCAGGYEDVNQILNS
ncbi:MAG: rhodanese-like domain-containing protein [Moheibacter sp.]